METHRNFAAMTRRTLLTGGALLRGAPARRPNIIAILADDLGYSDVGFQNCLDIPTPNLNRIAREGVRFSAGYVSHPFCSPSRAGLLTGRYQQRFGHEDNPRYDPADQVSGLPSEEVTLPQVLADAGYATGIIGKWHLGAAPKFHPLKRGFREQFGFIGGGHDYFRVDPKASPREYYIPLERDGVPVVESEYLTDAFSREAAAFVHRHRHHPFFLYLAYNAPHGPLQAPDQYLRRMAAIRDEKRLTYAAMVAALDDGVGQVLAALAETSLESDTLVIFLSDNGGEPNRSAGSNRPLRGHKGSLYEGGIRTPFAARWNGHLPAGKVFAEPVISLDIFATAAAIAGARVPSDVRTDGVNLMPYVRGKNRKPPHERLFWRTGGGEAYAVREGRYKLLKIGDRTELYDTESDIGETKDLAASRPALLKTLNAVREQWDRQLMAPRFTHAPAARKTNQRVLPYGTEK